MQCFLISFSVFVDLFESKLIFILAMRTLKAFNQKNRINKQEFIFCLTFSLQRCVPWNVNWIQQRPNREHAVHLVFNVYTLRMSTQSDTYWADSILICDEWSARWTKNNDKNSCQNVVWLTIIIIVETYLNKAEFILLRNSYRSTVKYYLNALLNFKKIDNVQRKINL